MEKASVDSSFRQDFLKINFCPVCVNSRSGNLFYGKLDEKTIIREINLQAIVEAELKKINYSSIWWQSKITQRLKWMPQKSPWNSKFTAHKWEERENYVIVHDKRKTAGCNQLCWASTVSTPTGTVQYCNQVLSEFGTHVSMQKITFCSVIARKMHINLHSRLRIYALLNARHLMAWTARPETLCCSLKASSG